MDDKMEMLLKVVIIGDSGVGKTNLLSRYSQNLFDSSTKNTIGVDFSAVDLTINKKAVKVQFWDTAGQEKYRAIASAYYKSAHGAIVVFDISKRETFENVSRWLSELSLHGEPNLAVLILANKSDLVSERQVSLEEGEALGKKTGYFFAEVSAKTNEGNCVKEAFLVLIKEVFKRAEKEDASNTRDEELSIQSKKFDIAMKDDKKKDSACCPF